MDTAAAALYEKQQEGNYYLEDTKYLDNNDRSHDEEIPFNEELPFNNNNLIHSSSTTEEIEDEDFSRLSLADPNSDSEEFFQKLERDINPWAKEDNLKKPPKYALDYRHLAFNPPTAPKAEHDQSVATELLDDENMADNADRTGENQIIDLPVPQSKDQAENDTKIIIQQQELVNNENLNENSHPDATSLMQKSEPLPTTIIEKQAVFFTKLHWLGITSFIVAVGAVLTLTLFDLYQTAARHADS